MCVSVDRRNFHAYHVDCVRPRKLSVAFRTPAGRYAYTHTFEFIWKCSNLEYMTDLFYLINKRMHVVSLNERSSLVDPASSHMLVSKIKPCMSQYKPN